MVFTSPSFTILTSSYLRSLCDNWWRFALLLAEAASLLRRFTWSRVVQAITIASIAWWRWSIRFLLKPFCSSNGISGIRCPDELIVVNFVVPVNSFIRINRGRMMWFHTSLIPHSRFSLSVTLPEHTISFFDVASCSSSSLTILDNNPLTNLLIYLLSFNWRSINSEGMSSIKSFFIFERLFL